MTTTADLRGISEVSALIRSRALSPVDLVKSCLARIDSGQGINAFITVLGDSAIEDARSAEADIARGRYRGPLHGVPVSVKDLVDVAGTPTTSGSAVPARRPAHDAPVVARLREAGAIIIGKTNLHEFAFGTTSDESAFGPVRNPKDPARVAGGSSGGAAAALAEGMCFGAVGTDTGGSIRIPSAACGTVGLKPTFGELPCDGVVPLSTTLDHVGPMTRTVEDAALMFQAMKGAPAAPLERAIGGLTFGIPRTYLCDRLDPDVRAALERTRETFAAAGHTVVDVMIEHAAWTPDVYLHIVLPEASRYHARTLEKAGHLYSPGVRLRLEMGRYLLAEDYVRAMRLRDHLSRAVETALEGVDALLLPALAIAAPTIGAASVDVDGTKEPTRAVMLRLTQLFNLSGHPAIALPAGATRDGLPVGMQLVGHRGRTERLLAVAAAVEPQMIGGAGSVGGGTG